MAARAIVVLGLLVMARPAAAGVIHAIAVDADHDVRLIGATIVITPDDGDAGTSEPETAMITDGDGEMSLEVAPGTYKLTIYYNEVVIERGDVVVGDGQVDVTLRVPTNPYVSTYTACFFEVPPFDLSPETGRTLDADAPLLWRRDHLGLGALDARGRGARSVTTIDGAGRLPGAPAIATELLAEEEITYAATRIERAGAAGGHHAVALRRGSNELAAAARVALGRRARASAIAHGAIEDDEAWWSTGVVLDHDERGLGVQALSTLNVALSSDRQGDLSFLVSTAPDGSASGWGKLGVMLRGDDAKRQLDLHVATEVLTPAETTAPAHAPLVAGRTLGGDPDERPGTTRTAVGLVVTQRHKTWRGHHVTTVGGEVGGGVSAGGSHADVRGFLGDAWQPKPDWSIDAGARWDRRVIGDTAAEVVSPRLAISWDPTKEGRKVVYAVAERVALLDERYLGAWTRGALHRDQATVGIAGQKGRVRWQTAAVAWLLHPQDLAGDPARRGIETFGDRGRVGLEGFARYAFRTELEAELAASSLERALTASTKLVCKCGKNRNTIAAIARATPGELAWGVSLQHRRGPSGQDADGPALTFGLDAYAGAGVPGTVQATLASDW